ncbi:DUF4377 domain-containing protein [Castellaniella sp.]|uniref:DUF4377 domain-containing protein n=1 Tax=Castellaniella sp. TaxID=1955812 RepID=UPI003C72632F
MKSTFAISALALLLGACAQAPAPETAAAGAPAAVAGDRARSQDQDVLIAHEWRLIAATDRAGRPIEALRPGVDRPLTLSFSASGLNVAGGCNMQFGGYTLASGVLNVSGLASTMKACSSDLMQLDAAVAARLKGRLQVRLEGGSDAKQLRLTDAAGDTLTFAGQLTPEARYGAGQVMFLEVAPDSVACAHPLIPDHRCLQVRERRYDDSGVLLPPQGDWRPLYQRIEGYAHQEGEHAILRVKRYTDKNPPADASSQIYRLDLVVQRGR